MAESKYLILPTRNSRLPVMSCCLVETPCLWCLGAPQWELVLSNTTHFEVDYHADRRRISIPQGIFREYFIFVRGGAADRTVHYPFCYRPRNQIETLWKLFCNMPLIEVLPRFPSFCYLSRRFRAWIARLYYAELSIFLYTSPHRRASCCRIEIGLT